MEILIMIGVIVVIGGFLFFTAYQEGKEKK
jgi:hypothetical protein